MATQVNKTIPTPAQKRVVANGSTPSIKLGGFAICICRLDGHEGVKQVYQEKNTGALWPDVFKRAIERGGIEEPGLYLGWYWAPTQCASCNSSRAVGTYTVISTVYTVRQEKGKLIPTEGVDLELSSPVQRLTTWPPR